MTGQLKMISVVAIVSVLLISLTIAVLADGNILITSSGLNLEGDWTAVEGSTNSFTKTVSTTSCDAVSSTLTISVEADKTGILEFSFDGSKYSGTDGSYEVKHGNTALTPTDGKYTVSDFSSANNVTIKISTSAKKNSSKTGTVYGVTFTEKKTVSVQFAADPLGIMTYTIDGQSITNPISKETGTTVSYAITNSTDDNYVLAGWHWSDGSNEGYYSVGSTAKRNGATGTVPVRGAYTVTPVVAYYTGDSAPLKANNEYWWTWETAMSVALDSTDKVITQMVDYTLPVNLAQNGLKTNGKYVTYDANGKRMTYIIPNGAKLLVPYNANDTGDFDTTPTMRNPGNTGSITCYPNDPIMARDPSVYDTMTRYGKSGGIDKLLETVGKEEFARGMYAYRTLTVPENTTINVAGELNVNSRVFVFGHHETGTPASTHGQIILEASTSVINVTGTLYCYGFITGEGTVNNYSNVYELLQLVDWRGATAAGAWKSSGTTNFLFSQYYVQNIECSYVVNEGSLSHAVVSLAVNKTLVQQNRPFIGNENTSGFFTLKKGYVTRKYMPSTERIIYTVEGDLSMDSITIEQDGLTFSSSDYILPLQNNIEINLVSGTTTITNDLKMLPNSAITVGKDANLIIGEKAELYIYDKNDWNAVWRKETESSHWYTLWLNTGTQNYGASSYNATNSELYDNYGVKALTVRYSPSRGNPNKTPSEVSAKLVVNGTLEAYGNIFASEHTGTAEVGGTNYDIDTGKDANKILFGTTGIFINHANSGSANWATAKLMESIQKDQTKAADGHVSITAIPVVGRIKGITANTSSYNSLGIGTYHALSDNYWYNYKVTSANAELITVSSTLAADSNANDDVVGYVSYDNAGNQSAFTFTVPEGYKVSAKMGESEAVELTSDASGVYTLTSVNADTELVLEAPCDHSAVIETPEVPATCDSPGTKAYWTCECGKIFADAEATIEIENLDIWKADEEGGLIPATGHSFAYVILESIDKTYNSYQYTCSCGAVGTFDDMMAEVGYQVQTLPEDLDFCTQGNLWNLFDPDEKYFYFGGTDFVPSWDDTYRKGDALSVTIPVQEGMKIYANSFEISHINTSGYAGAFVTFYIQDENGEWKAQAWSREYVYKLVVTDKLGYITVPEGAVYANISHYKGIQSPVLLINHIYEKGSTSNFTTPYSCATCNDVPSTMEEFQLLGGFTLQQLPENFGDGRNLWDSFIKDEAFYYVSSKNASPAWNGLRGTDDMQAITFAVTPGTQIYATSLQAEAGNGTTYVEDAIVRDGTWVTYFMNNGTTVQMQPSATYSEYNSNGYITVPENAVGVQIAFYNNKNVPVNQELKILSHSHSYDTGIVTIDPTCTEKGEKTYTCACGDSYTEEMPTIDHSYNEEHVCSGCGKQDIFDIYASNISVEDGLDLYFYVEKAKLHEDEEYYAVVNKKFADGYEVNGTAVNQITENISFNEWEDYNDEFMRFCFSDISAKEMTDTITATVYFADGDDTKTDIAASNTKEESIETYVVRTLDNLETDNPGVATKVKTALVDLVVYGASCQKHFNYNTSDLAEVGDTYSRYASTQMPEYENTPPSGTNFVAASVSAQNKLMYTFYFSGITAEQVEGLTATVTYTDWVDGSEIQLSISGNEFYKYPNADWYGVDIKGLSMVNGYQNLKCVVTDTEGTIIAEGVDSIASYVARAAEEDAQAVYTALISFVDSACTYFDSLRETLVG